MQRIRLSYTLGSVLVAFSVSAGCSTARAVGTPSAAAAPTLAAAQRNALDSLAGRWDFSVDLGTRETQGELWLFRRERELTGTLAPTGTNTLPVRSMTLRGDSAHMIVDTPEGPVTFDGMVAGTHSAMRGVVTYHKGQR